LGHIGFKEGVPTLLRLLEDKDPTVSAISFDVLCRIRPNQAISILTQATKDQGTLHAPGIPADARHRLQSLAASLDRLADLCE
jgi:HEAT repeat protein